MAAEAGVSRATLYRLFPGKSALLTEIIRHHSRFDSINELLRVHRGDPPSQVVPLLARTLAHALDGRMGLLLALLAEVSRDEDARTSFGLRSLPLLASYLEEQMDAGRLRKMDPVTALQALLGPMVMHLLARTATTAGLDDVVDEFVALWLRGMAPA